MSRAFLHGEVGFRSGEGRQVLTESLVSLRVAHDAGHIALLLADSNVPISVLFHFAFLNHPAKDIGRILVVLGNLLCSLKLLF